MIVVIEIDVETDAPSDRIGPLLQSYLEQHPILEKLSFPILAATNERMKAAGCVVALGVDVADARARASGGPARPLLANADTLAAERAPIYRRAHAVVDTTKKSIAEVATEVRFVEQRWEDLPTRHRATTVIAALGAARRRAVVTRIARSHSRHVGRDDQRALLVDRGRDRHRLVAR